MVKNRKSSKAAMLRSVFDLLRKNQKFWDCWRTTEQWISVINTLYPEAKEFCFTKTDLSTMLSRDPVFKHCYMQCGSQTNQHGVYYNKFKRGNIRNTAIYCCAPNTAVRKPPCDVIWWDDIAQRVPSLRSVDVPRPNKHSTNKTVRGDEKRLKIEAPQPPRPPTVPPTEKKLSDVIRQQSFWDSPKARILFWPNKDEDVLTATN